MPTSQGTLSSDANRHKKLTPVLICLALVILTLGAYWAVKDCGFINLDDNRYVYENAYVQSGLNWNSVKYAFSFDFSNWHPLTRLSWMLDREIFGPNPSGYHLGNLFLHVLNTLLLFLVLFRMTGAVWPCAFVAALFALHPLHVESVAWISERKDVLCTFFGLLSVGAYSFYVRRPGGWRYVWALLFFALGLMSKPMLVTLPFVLVLLDYWPLRRFQPVPEASTNAGQQAASYRWSLIYPLFREKIPFFALTVISCMVTYFAQKEGAAVAAGKVLSLGVRIGNALVSYIAYIRKMFWPGDLAVFYPYPEWVAPWQAIGAAILLIAVTAFVIWRAKKSPYLVTGWFWYLGTLVPVIGVVQVGSQAMADRYSYIPLIGLFMMASWGVGELSEKWRNRRVFLIAASALILAALMMTTIRQVGYWRDNITLFNHTLSVTNQNWLIHNNRGNAYNVLGQYQRAIDDYDITVSIRPDFVDVYLNRGAAYVGLENYRQAVEDFSRAIAMRPHYAEAYINRGGAYNVLGNYRQAVDDLNRGISIKPGYAEAYYSLAVAYGGLGDARRAVENFDRAIQIRPGYADAYISRGVIYLRQGDRNSGCSDARKACDLGSCELWRDANNEGLCR